MRPTELTHDAADLLRDRAEALRTLIEDQGGNLRDFALEKATHARRYIARRGPSGLAQDLVATAKDHPVAATATAIGLLYFASRLFRRNKASDAESARRHVGLAV